MINYPEQIALYLNLATSLIRGRGGGLEDLVSNVASIPSTAGGDCQETQCLLIQGTLWIANNDDDDTRVQRLLLDKLGIKDYDGLADYVDTYLSRVLRHPVHNTITYGGLSAKGKLLLELAGFDQDNLPALVAKPALPVNGSTNLTYALSSVNDPPLPTKASRIVFVTGSYEGVNSAHTKYHAEQKLLAALGRCYQRALGNSVRVFGCKMACSTCESVLDSVKTKLASVGISLKYTDAAVDALRKKEGIKLKRVTTHDISALKLSSYFG